MLNMQHKVITYTCSTKRIICHSVVKIKMNTRMTEDRGGVLASIMDGQSRDLGSIPSFLRDIVRILNL